MQSTLGYRIVNEAIDKLLENRSANDSVTKSEMNAGSELHNRSKEILMSIHELYKSLPSIEEIDKANFKAIDLNADQIQCIAEDIRYWARHGEVKAGYIEPQ